MYLESAKVLGIIKTCHYCGKKYIKDSSNGWGCCEECYCNKEVMICRECGKEITKFDFDDNGGLCEKCYFESDIYICLECGREFIRNDYSKGIICSKCEGE
ncbi:60S ribosomal export protein NMD3 [Romboutsia lituseburensis]|uniref:60S ribosomal export protein NMD3 n=1 Tax=Romboutsia lituseburensis TaxID=1537 RepID=UPI00215A12AC|nr:60S ribosomal export protein NMD3 [Romboutsia lituseburensis]MCR8744379.1 60S ribosomal export protein NMD3 [Romboutsia lituseburensis]